MRGRGWRGKWEVGEGEERCEGRRENRESRGSGRYEMKRREGRTRRLKNSNEKKQGEEDDRKGT